MHVRTPSALTEEALKRIGELYAIEAEIRGMTAEQRLAERQLKTKPLLKSLESWLREKMKTLSRHSELAKAFAYALNQWPALTYYADDGWAEADNNIAENALRMVSLGRKNYLFFGSDHGGVSAGWRAELSAAATHVKKGDPHQAGYAVHSFSLSYKPVSVKGFEASVTLDNAFNKLAMNGKGVPLSGRTVSLYTRYQW